jgi:hypothetical protein
MAIRAIQAAVREHWQSSVRLIAVAMWGVGLVGCAELGAIRSEMARLRADLMAYHTAMESLTERVQAIEQRGATSESGVAHPSHDLQQGVEVLLKKALEIDVRVSQLEATKNVGSRAPMPRPSPPKSALEERGPTIDKRQEISLGMTQEEVRQIIGDPLRTEYAGDYIFWHYSPLSYQKYVVFERENGRVSGWLGL